MDIKNKNIFVIENRPMSKSCVIAPNATHLIAKEEYAILESLPIKKPKTIFKRINTS